MQSYLQAVDEASGNLADVFSTKAALSLGYAEEVSMSLCIPANNCLMEAYLLMCSRVEVFVSWQCILVSDLECMASFFGTPEA